MRSARAPGVVPDASGDPRAFFGPRAEAYRASATHANRAGLDRMLSWIGPFPRGARALDVATGGGHTALALAERAARVVAVDATPEMLAQVARGARERRLPNVAPALADAHALPFRPASFEVVACRIAAHHFRNLPQFAREAARALRPGGALYVFDLTSPEDEEGATLVNRIEALRDPSHVRSHAPAEWRSALAAAGFDAERVETPVSRLDLEAWIARAAMPADRERELRRALASLPERLVPAYGVGADGARRVTRIEILARLHGATCDTEAAPVERSRSFSAID